jgi:monoamine oxidase
MLQSLRPETRDREASCLSMKEGSALAEPLIDCQVAIIGAGAAGIGAARRLAGHGVTPLLLEARDRIGGRAVTRMTRLGLPVDLGCEWLHSADRNPWTAIARKLGFAIDETLPEWSRRDQEPAEDDPTSEREWYRAAARFDARLEAAAQEADRAAAELLPPTESRTAESGAAARWNGLLNAISSWANGVELDRLSVHDHLRYADSGINWRLFDGYGTLIAAHGAGLPVELGCAVHRVDHGGKRIRLETDRGRIEADQVIVTVPTPLLAEEKIVFTPPLPDNIAAAQGLPLGVANKVFLALAGDVSDFRPDQHVLGADDRAATGSYQGDLKVCAPNRTDLNKTGTRDQAALFNNLAALIGANPL